MDAKRLQSIRDWWQGPQDFEFWDEQAIRESKLLKKAREYIPALVDEIDRQAAEIERLQAYAEYADIDRRMAQELGEKAAEIAALTARVERMRSSINAVLRYEVPHGFTAWSDFEKMNYRDFENCKDILAEALSADNAAGGDQ